MKIVYRILPAFFIPAVLVLFAYSTGSPGGKSGSPGDGNANCTQCHSGTPTAQTGWITSNIPGSGYTPGQTYQITATGTHSGVVKFGFELTAETSAGVKTGTFAITDAARTQLTNSNHAVTHTAAGNVPSGNTNTWTMNWTAPASNVGQIRFYAAFNAANGNGNTSGDVIYTSNLFVNAASPPALVSVSPTSAVQGSSPVLTITGQNTSWVGTTPSVRLRNVAVPAQIITASSVTVNSNTVLHANFTISISASTGLWDVLVDDLVLPSAFTVNAAVPALIAVNPDFADQGSSPTLAISGENTNWNGTNPVVRLRNVDTPSEILTASNVVVNSNTQLHADFAIPANASAGLWDVLVDNLTLASSFSVLALTQELVSVNPAQGDQGTNPSLTVTGSNTMWTGTSPLVRLRKTGNPADVITSTAVTVNNNTQLVADFALAPNATVGTYDLLVDDLVLSASFTVIEVVQTLVSISPDVAIQGESVMVTIMGSNTFWEGTSPAVSLVFNGSLPPTIEAQNVVVMGNHQLSAQFDIPLDAPVGLWNVVVNDLQLVEGFTVTLFEDINTFADNNLNIYPNPATEKFWVNTTQPAVLRIFEMKGRLVLETRVENGHPGVDVSTLNKGVYVVEIQSNGARKTVKLVVK
ncbi:MAG: T9SS type A sorting domain-containing protein [Bacteroidetes bacterium]|nr:T9SS type A sorting domain-containing protein [Bacteroidota bacterium]